MRLKGNGSMMMELYVKRVSIESEVGSSSRNLAAPNFEPEPKSYIQTASCFVPVQNHTLNSLHQHPNHDLIPESHLDMRMCVVYHYLNHHLTPCWYKHMAKQKLILIILMQFWMKICKLEMNMREKIGNEELIKKIREHHIIKNQEIRIKISGRDQIQVVCKTPSCEYELRAKSSSMGETWVITKQDKPHTYRYEASRTYYAQLTTSIIADIIKSTIKKDPCMSIQGVANRVRIKHDNVMPNTTYSGGGSLMGQNQS